MGFYMFIAQRNLGFLHLVIPTTTVHDGIFDYGILYTYIIFCIEKTILDITVIMKLLKSHCYYKLYQSFL